MQSPFGPPNPAIPPSENGASATPTTPGADAAASGTAAGNTQAAPQFAPPQGYGQPPPGYGQPPPGYGQPPGGFGAIPPGYALPPAGYPQPPHGFGAPGGFGSAVPPRRGNAGTFILLGTLLCVGFLIVAGAIGAAVWSRNKRAMRNGPIAGSQYGRTDAPKAGMQGGGLVGGSGVGSTSADSPVPLYADDPVRGDADALVTWVVFTDLQCPFCKRLDATMDTVSQRYSNSDLRIVWKDKPLAFHPQAQTAAHVGRSVFAVGGNAKFWQYRTMVFVGQTGLANFNFTAVAASDLQLSESALIANGLTGAAAAKVAQSSALADRVGATGTPTSFVNGIRMEGAMAADKFCETIDAQIIAARAQLSEGTARSQLYAVLSKLNYTAPTAKPTTGLAAPPTLSKTVVAVAIGESPVRGPKDALVTIVEFGDFQCPYCKRASDTIESVRAAHSKDVRLVWKDNPLTTMHKEAMLAANFARELRARKGDAAFWQAHDRLFDVQSKLSEPTLLELGTELNVADNELRSAFLLARYDRDIRRDAALAAQLKVSGTPAFFINGRSLGGAQPQAVFESAVVEELAAARAMLASGVPRQQLYARLSARGSVD